MVGTGFDAGSALNTFALINLYDQVSFLVLFCPVRIADRQTRTQELHPTHLFTSKVIVLICIPPVFFSSPYIYTTKITLFRNFFNKIPHNVTNVISVR